MTLSSHRVTISYTAVRSASKQRSGSDISSRLSFTLGVDLDDLDGLLEGGGKIRRHLTFKRLDDADANVVKRFAKLSTKL